MSKPFRSIRAKLTAAFVLITSLLLSMTIILHVRAMNAVRSSIYQEMMNNVVYYQRALDRQMENISQLQIDFFQDRKLPFLSGTDNSLLNDYERREAFLSVQERLRSLTNISDLVAGSVLYFPLTGYQITEKQISRMSLTQQEEMKAYLSFGNSDLHALDGQFFIARTGEVRATFSSNPHQLLVIRFSSDEIVRQLDLLTDSRDGGAFLYDEDNQILILNTGDQIGAEVLHSLDRNEEGSFISTQRIRVSGQDYLALAQPTQQGSVIIQYASEKEATAWIQKSWFIAWICLAIMVLFAILFIIYVQRIVHRPLSTLSEAFGRLGEGVLTEHIHHDQADEFSYIYDRFNNTEDHLNQLINEVYVQKNLAQKAQMKQLQAQINPHFLYNSFFILSRRIRKADLEGAEELSDHLGNYFKYLARDMSDDTPLADEVNHARSYAKIQGTRFAARMRIDFGQLPESWQSFRVPRLIIQPLLENAFKYGLENIAENALLRIRFEETDGKKLLITVEDNGKSDVDPAALQAAIDSPSSDVISGMANIQKRLNIYFNGKGRLQLQRSELGGLAATIILPGDQEVLQ